MMTKRWKTMLVLGGLLCAAPAFAQGAPKADSEGFVPESRPADMRPPVDEAMPAKPLVAGAYGFIWLAVLVYVGSVATRASRLSGEVAELRARLDRLAASGGR